MTGAVQNQARRIDGNQAGCRFQLFIKNRNLFWRVPLPLGEGAAKRRVRVPNSSEYTLIRRFAPPSPRGRRTRPSFGSDLGHLWSQTAVTAAADHLSKR